MHQRVKGCLKIEISRMFQVFLKHASELSIGYHKYHISYIARLFQEYLLNVQRIRTGGFNDVFYSFSYVL